MITGQLVSADSHTRSSIF